MPRKSNNFSEKGRERAEKIILETGRRAEYPEQYTDERYTDDEYSRHGKSSRNRYRKQHIERDYEGGEQNIQDYYSKGDEALRKDYRRGNQWVANDHPDDYETYTYEYDTQSYLKSPRSSGDIRHKERQIQKQRKERPSHERNSPEYPLKTKYGKEYPKEEHYVHNHIKASHRNSDSYPSDRTVLDHAATRIQAAYKGYSTRKDFWKKMEHHRRQKSLEDIKQYRKDEHIVASAVTTVDNVSGSPLATNADPNLGLTSSLPYIDSSQRNIIIKDLKRITTYSDDIKTVSQLQTETSPNIIVLGGINPLESKDYLLGASMFVYNIQKDRWFFAGTMPEPRNYHTAAYLNGKIYTIGGYSPFLVNHHEMVATQTTFQLTVRSRRWRRRGDMHQARACHGMCIVNDNIMVMGGRGSAGKLLSTVELYYPKRDQWVLLKPMPEALMGLSCAVLDGCVYVIGGIINEGNSSQFIVSNRVYAFDFEKQMWYRAAPLPEPRAFGCASTLKREIWLWCGVGDSLNEDSYLTSTNSVLVYNPDVSKWEQHTTIGTVKHAAAIVKFGRRVYLLGGMSNASGSKEVLNENDFYNYETDKYREGAALPSPLAGTTAVALPIDYIATSDPKWNTENINEQVMNEAATKIQAVFRGYKTRSSTSNHKFPVYDSDSMKKNSRMDAFVYHASVTEPQMENWKIFQRVEIDDWPPIPDPQVSNSDVNLRFGTLPKGYTITSTNNRTKVRRYVCLPPHADPNMSMIGHLCNVYKRAKKILGLRKVERLPAFAINLITAPTLQDDSLPVILAMGGLQPRDPVNLSYGKLILRYHILKNRWEYFGALPEPRNYHAAVYHQEHIYVTGGCDPDYRNSGEMVATNTTFCLNIHSSEWVEKAQMHCSRSYHNLIVALGKIFAIGGRDNNGRLVASIEAYDTENDKWSILRPMINPRMGMACAIVDDHIWCLGGIGLSDDLQNLTYPVLSSVISYDIGKDVWITRPPLRCPRAFASCVVVENALWLCGGASKDRANSTFISMGSIDKYYPTEAQWTRKTLINNPRHCAAVVAIDTCIYILGGVSSQEWSPLSRNEMIVVNDISLHTCKELPVPLTGLAAVAVPPVLPSLRSESLAILLHTKLTYH